MALDSTTKVAVIRDYQRGSSDTGSADVQVALLTTRINSLAEHFKKHAHDFHSREGLLRMIHKRRKLLDYVRKHDAARYRDLIGRLGLRR